MFRSRSCDAIVLFSEAVKSASVRNATCEACTARHLALQIDTVSDFPLFAVHIHWLVYTVLNGKNLPWVLFE